MTYTTRLSLLIGLSNLHKMYVCTFHACIMYVHKCVSYITYVRVLHMHAMYVSVMCIILTVDLQDVSC